MQITFQDVYFTYPGKVNALSGVTLPLPTGVTGLLGPNGAGKSTLMNLLVGLQRPSRGQVLLDGCPLAQVRTALYRCLGYLPQRFIPYPALTVEEFLDYMALLKGLNVPVERRRRITAVLDLVHLSDARHRRTATLSGGMRQRLGIAQALLSDPQVLVLDEPTAGLDPEERQRFRSLLAELAFGRSVLISSHIVGDLSATCERLLVLESGRLLYAGAPEALRSRAVGQVWEMRVPIAGYERLRSAQPSAGFHIASARKEGAVLVVRMVTPPGGEASSLDYDIQPVEPLLEDAYVALRAGVRLVAERAVQ